MTMQGLSVGGTGKDGGKAAGLVSRKTVALLLVCCLVIWFTTAFRLWVDAGSDGYVMTDIDTFWLVGHMVWEGRLAEAYSADTLFAAQESVLKTHSFMPYTYPPQFNFLTALIGPCQSGCPLHSLRVRVSRCTCWPCGGLPRRRRPLPS
jgi:hypothetical protein